MHAEECSQTDEDGVDQIQIERASRIKPVTRRDAEPGGTDRWHKCRSDGHSRNDVARPLADAAQGNDTRQSAAKSDEHVVYGRRRAGEQFRLRLSNWSHQEIERSGEHTEHGGREETAERAFEQFKVVDTYAQPHTHNRPHNRRNKHGADDYGGRVGVQSQ